jgi:hypothetical protein
MAVLPFRPTGSSNGVRGLVSTVRPVNPRPILYFLLSIALLKIASWSLGTGNIIPLLALLVLTPIGTVAAALVKPQLLGFMVLHAYARNTYGIRTHTANLLQRYGLSLPILGDFSPS